MSIVSKESAVLRIAEEEATKITANNPDVIGHLLLSQDSVVFFVNRELSESEREAAVGRDESFEAHFLVGPTREVLKDDPHLFQRTVLMYQGLPAGWRMAKVSGNWQDAPTL